MKKLETPLDPLAEARAIVERHQAREAEAQQEAAEAEGAERQLATAEVNRMVAGFAGVRAAVEAWAAQSPPDGPTRREHSFGHWPQEAANRVATALGVVRDAVTMGQHTGAALLEELAAPLAPRRQRELPELLESLQSRLRVAQGGLEGLRTICGMADGPLATAVDDLDAHRRWYAVLATGMPAEGTT